MMRTLSSILILCTVLISPLISLAQGWHSAKLIRSINAYSSGTTVVTDKFGNVFMSAVYGGSGIYLDSFLFLGVPNHDYIIAAKYDSAGNFLWGTSSNNMGSGYPINMACDRSGNLIIFGTCYSPFVWHGHSISDTMVHNKYFLVKINPYGSIIWLKSVADIRNTVAPSTPAISGGVAVDNDDNIYVTGGLVDSVNNIEGHTHRGRGGADIFINKYTPSGDLIWTKSSGGKYDDLAWGIAATQAGNFYITGSFSSDTLFQDSVMLIRSGGGSGLGSVFVTKFDSSGNVIWSKAGVGNGVCSGVAADIGENVYITGMSNSIRFDSISLVHTGTCICLDMTFTAKFNSSGGFEWAKKIDGTGPEIINGITVDPCNNVWISTNCANPSGYGDFPSIISEYAPDGSLLESKMIQSGYFCRQLASDLNRNIYLASVARLDVSNGPRDFIVGPSRYYFNSNAGDGYIAKYVPASLSWDTVYAHSDTTFCSSSVMTMEPPAGYLAYLWDDGIWSNNYTISRADTHTVFCYPTTCASPILAETIHTHVDSLHTFSLGSDTASCVPFYLSAPYPGLHLWHDGSTIDSIEILTSGTYALTITEGACTFSDTINVIIDSTPCADSRALMPNAFSPNNDGTNDRIRPFVEKNSPVSEYSFTVYNKYGVIVFNTNDPLKAWDGSFNGRSAETGVYIYNIKYKAANGSKPHNYSGNITLVR